MKYSYRSFVLCLALFCLGRAVEGQDALRDMGSKDVQLRLDAIESLVESREKGAVKALLRALEDDDWEVSENAARGLGILQAPESLNALCELALEGPVRRLRLSAAKASAQVDSGKAFERYLKKLKGKGLKPLHACEALQAVALGLDEAPKLRSLERLFKGKDLVLARAAVGPLLLAPGDGRKALLKKCLGHQDLVVQARALEAVQVSGDLGLLELLMEFYLKDALPDVLRRRAERALVGIAGSQEESEDALSAAIKKAQQAGGAKARRLPRLIEALSMSAEGRWSLPEKAGLELLGSLLESDSADVRAASFSALGRLASKPALGILIEALSKESGARARRVALIACQALLEQASDKQKTRLDVLASEWLGSSSDLELCIQSAVLLGRRDNTKAQPALKAALGHDSWEVSAVAAVALGKTKIEGAVGALLELANSDQWQRRSAAIAGLAQLRAKQGVPTIIKALEDVEPAARHSALAFLKQISKVEHGFDRSAWEAWWDSKKERTILKRPQLTREQRNEAEYVVDPKIIYKDLDMIVFESRGDHIQEVLDFLELEHRLTHSGAMAEDGLHPDGVFVANCTGEMTTEEVQRVRWFVLTGGSLFGSCWALGETIDLAFPNRMRASNRNATATGDVYAYATDLDNPYVRGVFDGHVRPIYHLEGAYLIEVLDHEIVEVLVDSPECAAQFGNGNLVAWFPAGHGVVLDSANHFDLQGFQSAAHLKQPEDRMAYAVDHFGFSYEQLREVRKDKFWKKMNLVAARIRDLSVFRLVTNFVNQTRLH